MKKLFVILGGVMILAAAGCQIDVQVDEGDLEALDVNVEVSGQLEAVEVDYFGEMITIYVSSENWCDDDCVVDPKTGVMYMLGGDGVYHVEGTDTISEEEQDEVQAAIEAAQVEEQDLITIDDLNADYDSNICVVTNVNTGEVYKNMNVQGFFTGCGIANVLDSKAYVYYDPDGMGGYILYGGYAGGLYELDLETGESRQIEDAISFSDDGKYVFRRNYGDDDNYLIVENLETGEEVSHLVPDWSGQWGTPALHEDGEIVAYSAAVGDPSDEGWTIFVSYPSGEYYEVEYLSEERLDVVEWQDDTLVYTKGGVEYSVLLSEIANQ